MLVLLLHSLLNDDTVDDMMDDTLDGTVDDTVGDKVDLSMHFCPGTITTHAESINSDLQRGLDRRLQHTQH